MERSISSAKNCFVKALIDPNTIGTLFAAVYHQWFDFIQDEIRIESRFIIYSRTNPEILLNHINQQSRIEGKNISLQFSQQLHRLLEKYIRAMESKCRLLTINSDTKLNQETLIQILYFV